MIEEPGSFRDPAGKIFYLNGKIKYNDIIYKLLKIISLNEFVKFKKISPKSVSEIINLDKYVRLKITSKSV